MEEENVPSRDSTPPESETAAEKEEDREEEKEEKEEKTQVNVEVLEDGDAVTSQIYQIRPQLHEKYFDLVSFLFSNLKCVNKMSWIHINFICDYTCLSFFHHFVN